MNTGKPQSREPARLPVSEITGTFPMDVQITWPPLVDPLYIRVDISKSLAWNSKTAQELGELLTEALVSRAKADKHK